MVDVDMGNVHTYIYNALLDVFYSRHEVPSIKHALSPILCSWAPDQCIIKQDLLRNGRDGGFVFRLFFWFFVAVRCLVYRSFETRIGNCCQHFMFISTKPPSLHRGTVVPK